MKLKAFGEIVVVMREPKEKMTKSGIHLPDKYGDDVSFGEVLSGGDIVPDGSRIVYVNTGGMTIEGQELILRKSILAVIEE